MNRAGTLMWTCSLVEFVRFKVQDNELFESLFHHTVFKFCIIFVDPSDALEYKLTGG